MKKTWRNCRVLIIFHFTIFLWRCHHFAPTMRTTHKNIPLHFVRADVYKLRAHDGGWESITVKTVDVETKLLTRIKWWLNENFFMAPRSLMLMFASSRSFCGLLIVMFSTFPVKFQDLLEWKIVIFHFQGFSSLPAWLTLSRLKTFKCENLFSMFWRSRSNGV